MDAVQQGVDDVGGFEDLALGEHRVGGAESEEPQQLRGSTGRDGQLVGEGGESVRHGIEDSGALLGVTTVSCRVRRVAGRVVGIPVVRWWRRAEPQGDRDLEHAAQAFLQRPGDGQQGRSQFGFVDRGDLFDGDDGGPR